MSSPRKIVLHSLHGYHPGLEAIVSQWIREGVGYAGVVGVDAALIEEAIDSFCVGDGTHPYFMLTTAHGPDETLQDAIFLAEQLSGELAGDVHVVEF